MARSGFPSMTALLGLLAVAGYQNRDRLGQMLGGAQGRPGGLGGLGNAMGGTSGVSGMGGGGMAGLPGGLGGLLGSLMGGGSQGGAQGGSHSGLGGLLGGGLNELQGRFQQSGHQDRMESWVATGPNRDIEPHDLAAALGPEVLDDLTETTGLDRDEILRRLSRELPQAVDQYTPQGRLPQANEFD